MLKQLIVILISIAFLSANAQNVGIGTNSPSFKLDVRNGSINTDSLYRIGGIRVISTYGNNNLSVGQYAGAFNSGALNSFFGNYAGYNTTGSDNSFLGAYAGAANTSGSSNTFVGLNAGSGNSTGNNQAVFGRNAGYYGAMNENLTLIGAYANVSTLLLNFDNATAIGYNAAVNASHKVRIGNSAVTMIEGQVAWSFPSDGRFKTDIRESVPGLSFIMKLRPVTYHLNAEEFDNFLHKNQPSESRSASRTDYSEAQRILHSGFVAQEVAETAKIIGYDFDGVHLPKNPDENYSIAYSQFVVPLVKAVQEQQAIIENQNKKIEVLLREIEVIKKRLK